MSKPKTRRATEADRQAALDALERANIPAIDVATELNTYPEKWSLKHCRAAMCKAGMDDEDIDAVFAANDPAKDEAQDEAQEYIADAHEVESADGEQGNEGQQDAAGPDTPPDAPPAHAELADAPEDDAPADLLSNPHNVHKLGRETIEVEQELTNEERLEVAARMAKALADRDRLELEFSVVKKDYKAKIDLAVSEAAEAGAEFRAGARKLSVRAVKLEDRTTMEIVYVEPDGAQRELMRRPMTHEERKLPLPMQQSEHPVTQPIIGTTELTPDNARTCITCGHMTQGDAELSEPCQTCSQCGNGDADNWEAMRHCATCTDSTSRVALYPCNGCSLNADTAHRGDEDRWTWKEAGKELTKFVDGLMDGPKEAEGMPTAADDAPAEEETTGDAEPSADVGSPDETSMPMMPMSDEPAAEVRQ